MKIEPRFGALFLRHLGPRLGPTSPSPTLPRPVPRVTRPPRLSRPRTDTPRPPRADIFRTWAFPARTSLVRIRPRAASSPPTSPPVKTSPVAASSPRPTRTPSPWSILTAQPRDARACPPPTPPSRPRTRRTRRGARVSARLREVVSARTPPTEPSRELRRELVRARLDVFGLGALEIAARDGRLDVVDRGGAYRGLRDVAAERRRGRRAATSATPSRHCTLRSDATRAWKCASGAPRRLRRNSWKTSTDAVRPDRASRMRSSATRQRSGGGSGGRAGWPRGRKKRREASEAEVEVVAEAEAAARSRSTASP